MAVSGIDLGKYKLGWSDSTEDYIYTPTKGLNEDIVREISHRKSEPEWMTKFRLNALKRFERKPMLEWFAKNMPDIDFDDIYYYLKPTEGQVADWDMLPESMQKTYEKLGIPEAERKYLSGVSAQFESEVVYHRNREELARTGVVFTDMDTAVRADPLHHDPELVAERLQPRHEARPRRARGHGRVDRRQPLLEAHDEVPRGRDGRAEGARRGVVDRVRRRGPTPGRGGEDDARRIRDHLDHRLEVDRQGRRPHELPRAREGRGGRAPREEPRALRCVDPRRSQPVRHVAAHGSRREGRSHRSRSDRVEGGRRPDLLPDEPRSHRTAGHRDDRERLHRTDHEDAADGIRRRALAPDRAQHGGRGWLRRGFAAHVSRRPSRGPSGP